jgi:hypothetical protein
VEYLANRPTRLQGTTNLRAANVRREPWATAFHYCALAREGLGVCLGALQCLDYDLERRYLACAALRKIVLRDKMNLQVATTVAVLHRRGIYKVLLLSIHGPRFGDCDVRAAASLVC